MLKKLIIRSKIVAYFLQLSCLLLIAQTVSAERVPHFILDAHTEPINLGVYSEYIEDVNGYLSLEEVRALPRSNAQAPGTTQSDQMVWKQAPQNGLAQGFTRSVYWLRFTVENATPEDVRWNLELGYPVLDNIEFFSPVPLKDALASAINSSARTVSYTKQHVGVALPFEQRPISYRNIVFPIMAEPKSVNTYYMRIKTASSMNVPLIAWPGDTFYNEIDSVKMLLGFLYGIVFLALLVALMNTVFLKDLMYLWLSGTFIGLLVYLGGIKGVCYQYLWPEAIWWRGASIPFCMGVTYGFALQSCRIFTSLKTIAPRTDRVVFGLVIFNTLAGVLSLLVPYETVIRFFAFSALLNGVLCFAIGVFASCKKMPSARLYMVSWLSLVVGAIIFTVTALGLIPRTFLSDWSQEIGFCGMAILMTIAQFDRFLKVQRTHEAAQIASLDAVKNAEQKYRALFENAIEGIFQMQEHGFLTNANRAFTKIVGAQNLDKLLGDKAPAYSLGFLAAAEAEKLEEILHTQDHVFDYETSFVDGSGETRWVSISIGKVQLGVKNKFSYEGSIADITETKKREQAEKQRRMAEASTEAKSMFLANMSHEIRTPMNAIMGFTEIAIATNQHPKTGEFLGKIKLASANLLGIINDILDFSKMETGKLSVVTLPFSVRELMDNFRNIIGASVVAKGLQFNIEVDADIPDMLIGDAQRIHQVLVNLTKNAVKFTDAGQVSVELALVELDKNTGFIELEGRVTDTGIGISEEKQKTLFSSFTQVDESTTRLFGGTGLGLSIAKKLLEMMDGRIRVRSEEGKGSCFEFNFSCRMESRLRASSMMAIDSELSSTEQIPIAQRIPGSKQIPRLTAQTVKEKYDFSGLRALLVEDVVMNQELATEILRAQGISVSIANNGQEGLDMTRKGQFDFILMDMQMPVMDGCQATKAIREFNPSMPIIAMTANAMADDKAKCLASGMNDYVTKPIDDNALFSAIVRRVEGVKARSQIAKQVSTQEQGMPEPQEAGQLAQSAAAENIWAEELACIDLKNGLDRCQGNQKLYLKLFRDFIRNYGQAAEQLGSLLAQSDLDTGGRLAHTLKGLSASLGAKKLPAIALKLEHIETVPKADHAALLANLQTELAALVADMQRVLALEPEAPAETIAVADKYPVSALKEKLAELGAMIREQKMDAYDQAILLAAHWPIAEHTPTLEQLVARLDEFDFDAALGLVNVIEQGL